MADERMSQRTAPPHCFVDDRNQRVSSGEFEPLDRIDRTEYLRQSAAIGVETELHVLALTLHAMSAHPETMAIDLEAVPETGLHDAFALLDLAEQTVNVGNEIVLDIVKMSRNDGTKE